MLSLRIQWLLVRLLLFTLVLLAINPKDLLISPVSADDGEDNESRSEEASDNDDRVYFGPRLLRPDEVQTSLGHVRGKMFLSRHGRSYSGFLGIPYANFSAMKRFQTAVPIYTPWEGILDATEFGPPCIQYNSLTGQTIGEEDCLHLNVFTPMVRTETPTTDSHLNPPSEPLIIDEDEPEFTTYIHMHPEAMPVIVFIHGGSGKGEFQEGSNVDFGTGQFFMDEDVVLVTLNYRLGPFGFLSTGDRFALGNMGLKDQLLAWEWVHKNIAYFGGDPFRVTVFGEGAGGMSVHYLMISPISQGLFHHAITVGGTSLDPGAFASNPVRVARSLGEKIGCSSRQNSTSTLTMIQCLRMKNPKELAEAAAIFQNWSARIPFGPTFESIGTFIVDDDDDELEEEPSPVMLLPIRPYKLNLELGTFNKIPWMIGISENEGLLQAMMLLKDTKLMEMLNSNWNETAPKIFMYNDKVPEQFLNAISEDIRKYYFGDSMIGPKMKENLTNLFTDVFYLRGMRMALQRQVSKGQSMFPLMFNMEGRSPNLLKFGVLDEAAHAMTHGDVLQYLFEVANRIPSKYEPGSEFEKRSRMLVRLWTTFAKFGVIPAAKKPDWISNVPINPGNWLKVTGSGIGEMSMDKFDDRFQFWDKMYDKFGM